MSYKDQNAINTKWIFLSTFFTLSYWFLPSHNKYVALTILYFSYLGLSWYDYLFAKSFEIPTYLSKLFSWGYPPHSVQKIADMKIQKNIVSADVFLYLLLLILAPLFVRWDPPEEDDTIKTRNANIFFGVCVFVFLFLRYTYN